MLACGADGCGELEGSEDGPRHLHPQDGPGDDDDIVNHLDNVEELYTYLRSHPPKKWGAEEDFERAMGVLEGGGKEPRVFRARYDMVRDMQRHRAERSRKIEQLQAEMEERRKLVDAGRDF